MEDFLREKMDGFDTGAAPDWDSFEPRLEKALMFQRLKQGALVSVVLIILGLGAMYTSDFLGSGSYSYYQPRSIHKKQAPAPQTSAVAESPMALYERKAQPAATETPAGKANTTTPAKEQPTGPSGTSPNQAALLASAGGMVENQPDLQEPAEVEEPREDARAVQVDEKSLSADFATKLQVMNATPLSPRDLQMPLVLKKRDKPYISPLQEQNPWSYSLNVYPNFTFRKFEVDPEKKKLLHRDFIDAMQVSESGGMSLNIGFKVSRRIGPITYLNSGAEYISYKTEAYFNFTNFRDAQISPETGEIVAYNVKAVPEQISFTDKNVYHYLNIPLSISHQPWANEYIRLNVEAGGSFMYFLTAHGNTIDYQTLDIMDLSERNYRNTMGSFFVKVGATYHLNQKFNFGFEPTLMYFTNTIYTEEYPFRVIPYSVGMNLKLQMKLN